MWRGTTHATNRIISVFHYISFSNLLCKLPRYDQVYCNNYGIRYLFLLLLSFFFFIFLPYFLSLSRCSFVYLSASRFHPVENVSLCVYFGQFFRIFSLAFYSFSNATLEKGIHLLTKRCYASICVS